MATSFITAMAAASLISCGVIDGAHVSFDSHMILIFESDESSKSLDTRYCYNSVANRRVLRRIHGIISSGRRPRLEVTVVNNFFHDASLSYNIIGHYTYHGVPVADFCDRSELLIIRAAR